MRCADQTIAQLHRYFEDVVLENNLASLVVESLPVQVERSPRSAERVLKVGRAARHAFFFIAPEDAYNEMSFLDEVRGSMLLSRAAQGESNEHFVIIADARFSALLVSLPGQLNEGSETITESEVIWTFEPDIVYSALEYLMARVTAERFEQTEAFSQAVRTCMPKATSLQLTVSVTTKLARLLQEQAAREVAINRIASAIRSSLSLPSVLQTTVDEVGRALGVQLSGLHVEGENEQSPVMKCYFRDGEPTEENREALVNDLYAYHTQLTRRLKHYVLDEQRGTSAQTEDETRPLAVVPLLYQARSMGVLLVCSDDPHRIWQENELLLLRTVADQVAVAVNHARLFTQMQQLALTDGLTGCVNRRSFEMQLERDLRLATRMRQPVSLIMLDIDHFKRVNDTYGHDAGDAALRFLADVLRDELRGVDTAARYGGEEFAVILPQAGLDGALIVAERLRSRLETTEVPGIGYITGSFGLATFPLHANSRDGLVGAADRALYEAKHAGRNRICTPPSEQTEVSDEMYGAPVEMTAQADADAAPGIHTSVV
ncbi:MAG TPA: sensor domain-containing diguanylate cyclase [Pyrinomonadaceae bacterium]|nr:sensor domain-containing diguanylate cyclase [Pyrinomonadaceae bacterium]